MDSPARDELRDAVLDHVRRHDPCDPAEVVRAVARDRAAAARDVRAAIVWLSDHGRLAIDWDNRLTTAAAIVHR